MIEAAAKTPILFVDDEPCIIAGLRRMLRGMRSEWDLAFATGPVQALDLLAVKRFEVVVSDMRMPGMNGAELLARVRRRCPGTARIILSAQTDQETFLGAMGTVHQFLAKPCTPEIVKRTIERAQRLQRRFADPVLTDLVGAMEALPSPPRSYTELMSVLSSPESTASDVASIAVRDPGLIARILKLVNSAMYGLRREIVDIPQAVALLGLDTLRSLATSTKVLGVLGEGPPGFDAGRLSEHSLAVAKVARRIARETCADEGAAGEVFLGAMLHDCGKLALAVNLPERYEAVLQLAGEQGMAHWQAEQCVFGTTHAEIGACMLGLWGLPESLVDMIAAHHQPGVSLEASGEIPVVTALHVADALVREIDAAAAPGDAPAVAGLDEEYLDAVGATQHLPAWRDLARREIGAR